ncbi:MAG TPA: hypothetical protein VE046_07575 [Steroidobacteraceae bacterium]|nr:hypothetical protein [Steroidobacteraceae bacterium]
MKVAVTESCVRAWIVALSVPVPRLEPSAKVELAAETPIKLDVAVLPLMVNVP